jgi:hypothetical protein
MTRFASGKIVFAIVPIAQIKNSRCSFCPSPKHIHTRFGFHSGERQLYALDGSVLDFIATATRELTSGNEI